MTRGLATAFLISNLAISLILLFSAAIAQDENPYSIYDFSGGMNTVDNLSIIPKNQGYKYYNLMLDTRIGSLSPRPGYRAVTDSVAGYDKILSIYGHKWADGRGCIFQILDRDDTCYGDLYISNIYSYGADDSIGSLIYPNKIYWLSWLNNIYLFNGKNVAQIITGAPDNPSMRDILPHAPGEPKITPLDITGPPYGNFVYQIFSKNSETPLWQYAGGSYTSRKIFVDSNLVQIYKFNRELTETTVDLYITKSRPNRTNFGLDSLFIFDSLIEVTPEELDTCKIIDSSAGDFSGDDYFGLIGDRHYELNAPTGVPDVMDMDIVTTSTHFISAGKDYDRFHYTLLYLDTVNQAISDTGRTLLTAPAVPYDDTLYKVTLWIPPVLDNNYVRLLYRNAQETDYPHDWTAYYFLDTIKSPTDTSYIDSLNVDSVNDPLNIETPLSLRFNGAVIHEDRMFAWDDHNVYMSGTGKSGEWGNYQIISFEMDDGERIIRLKSVEGGVVVYETKSIFIIYTQDGFATYASKKTSGIGMIAPMSMANYNGASLFLSDRGTTIETANIYQENSLVRETFSKKIKNLAVRDLDDMVSGVGMSVDDIYLLSYPGTDSLFAFFHATGGWSVWSFDFSEAILYDTLRRKDYTPFGQMIFIKDDDERIFVWNDGDTTDDGQDYYAAWGKTFWTPTMDRIIPEFLHIVRTASVADSDTIFCIITDESGDTVSTFNIDSLNSVSGYTFISTTDSNKTAHQLNLDMVLPNRSNLLINRLDFGIKSVGPDKPTIGE